MYLIFDTETTGLPKNWKAPLADLDNWPRMVQLAWQEYEGDNLLTSKNYIIKPEGFEIPKEASDVHGIVTEKALAEGVDLKEKLEEFADAIARANTIVAHNMSFDEKIVGAEFMRKQVSNRLFNKRRVCTKDVSTDYCQLPGKYGYKWPKLEELHRKLFDEDFEGAHDASMDVSACARCFFKLMELGIIQGDKKIEITEAHKEAIRKVKDGADIFDANVTKLLRDCEKEGLVIIVPPVNRYDKTIDKLAFFGAKATNRGKELIGVKDEKE